MAIGDALRHVIEAYPTAAATEAFAANQLAAFIRGPARGALEDALGPDLKGLKVTGSAGAGNWAEVPWVSVFDRSVTESATRGYYVVYLFHSTQPVVHLSLNQGTTATREEFGSDARTVLRDRAVLIRQRLKDFADRFPVANIELGSEARLPGDYAAGHALGVTYDLATLPDEEQLRRDLREIVRAYRALTFRGGLDPSLEAEGSLEGDFALPPNTPIVEIRRYREHRRIERNPLAAKKAKEFHGARCQACSLSFGERYGAVGTGFIEAHHLKPIGSLEEGVATSYDVAEDFAVLCANCHRMIHLMPDPSDLAAFRSLVVENTQAEQGTARR